MIGACGCGHERGYSLVHALGHSLGHSLAHHKQREHDKDDGLHRGVVVSRQTEGVFESLVRRVFRDLRDMSKRAIYS